MRIMGLCVLFALCLSPILRAQELSKSIKSDPATSQNPSDLKSPEFQTQIRRDLAADGETTYCAFLRTYRVEREHRGSDVVRLAGYTKCVPTKRFEMKSAVLQSSPQ